MAAVDPRGDATGRVLLPVPLDEFLRREKLSPRSVFDPYEAEIREAVERRLTQTQIHEWLKLNGIKVNLSTLNRWITSRKERWGSTPASTPTRQAPAASPASAATARPPVPPAPVAPPAVPASEASLPLTKSTPFFAPEATHVSPLDAVTQVATRQLTLKPKTQS